jgi:hypothetical protein
MRTARELRRSAVSFREMVSYGDDGALHVGLLLVADEFEREADEAESPTLSLKKSADSFVT